MRECQKLSKRQRAATPLPFALWLLARLRAAHGCHTVAVLWVQPRSIYTTLDGCDCWGVERDARTYAGPHPIIAHPPCGGWGKLAGNSRQPKEDGRIAMRLVERWGGVVEQPVGSHLFAVEAGFFAGQVEQVDQGGYGHLARKPTLLYWCRGT